MIELYIVLGVAVLLGVWAIAIYNKLVRRRNLVEEGWSGIDVQLKRRTNLVPNLVESVKGYMGQERDVLTRVTELRSQSLAARSPGERGQAEGPLGQALANLFAVAEGYPDLKSNQNFLDLQNELSELEEQIQLARRYYNGTVRNLNILIESFPSNLVARAFRFIQAEFFEIEEAADRAVPEMSFEAAPPAGS
jgi:LemA protein